MNVQWTDEQLVLIGKGIGQASGSAALPGQSTATLLTSEAAQVLHELKMEIRSNNSPWLTRQGAADYAHCSVSHIDYLAQRGEVKRYPGPRFRKEDIDKCITQGRFVQRVKAEEAI